MKVIQVINNLCHWDATPVHPTLESTKGLYAPNIIFVEAPDYVREGWGFDWRKQGDERFIEPIPPEGFAYDKETGTFYAIDENGNMIPADELAPVEEVEETSEE